jgi:hypothetical protein
MPVVGTGGEVRVECADDTAQILSATPAPGYQLTDYHPGPSGSVKAVFTAGPRRTEITVRCKGGTAAPQVKESQPH